MKADACKPGVVSKGQVKNENAGAEKSDARITAKMTECKTFRSFEHIDSGSLSSRISHSPLGSKAGIRCLPLF